MAVSFETVPVNALQVRDLVQRVGIVVARHDGVPSPEEVTIEFTDRRSFKSRYDEDVLTANRVIQDA